MYGCVYIDVEILVYPLYHLVFSVSVVRGLDNEPGVNEGIVRVTARRVPASHPSPGSLLLTGIRRIFFVLLFRAFFFQLSVTSGSRYNRRKSCPDVAISSADS